jgi:hypothetical protein
MRNSDNPWLVYSFDVIIYTAGFFCVIYALSMLEGFWTSGGPLAIQVVVGTLALVAGMIVIATEIDQRFSRADEYTNETITKLLYWLRNEPERDAYLANDRLYSGQRRKQRRRRE